MKRKTYTDLKYSIRILNAGDGAFSVEVPRLPGCYSSGRSKEECIENAVEAIGLHLEGMPNPPVPDLIPAIEVVNERPRLEDHLVSLQEACRFLDISDATIRRYIKDGRLPAYNLGKEYKFKIQELAAFVDSRRLVVVKAKGRKVPARRKAG